MDVIDICSYTNKTQYQIAAIAFSKKVNGNNYPWSQARYRYDDSILVHQNVNI